MKFKQFLQTISDPDGFFPVPNAVREPGQVKADFPGRIKEILGDDFDK